MTPKREHYFVIVLAALILLAMPATSIIADELVDELPTPTVPFDPTGPGGAAPTDDDEDSDSDSRIDESVLDDVNQPSRGGINWPLEGLLSFAEQDINRFWSNVFDKLGLRYFPLQQVQGYTTAILTDCGPARLNNAFYCGRSHSIHFDTRFLSRVQQRIGSFAAVTVLAHEWGHAVQAMLGGFSVITVQNELQADCLAGVYAREASRSPLWNTNEILSGANFLSLVGDPEGTSFSTPGAHGTSQQRNNAFMAGFESGLERCFVHF